MNTPGSIESYFGTHFGTYAVCRDPDGRPVLAPFAADPAPSPLGQGLLEIADYPLRIQQPMVRKSFLEPRGRCSGELRGAEPCVPVDWHTALDLVHQELARVIGTHGNRTVFGGSCGWASAGRFHHAQSQLKRFLNLTGGFVGAVNTYSCYGAVAVILPHVLGAEYGVVGQTAPSWDRIAELTEAGTARHADIVLPVSLPSERFDLVASARDNWLIHNRRLLNPPPQVRSDFEIFRELARRCGREVEFTEGRDWAGWIAHLYAGYRERYPELPAYEHFAGRGYCALDESLAPPAAADSHDLLAAFVSAPQANPLQTPSGRIELFSKVVASFGYEDCPGQPSWLPPTEWLGAPLAARYPVHLITNQPAHRLHSQLDAASASQKAKVAGREAVALNPDDAAERGIRANDVVRIFKQRGTCLAGSALDAELMRGVAVLTTGANYNPFAPEGEQPFEINGNANVLTADCGTSRLSQGQAVNCLVGIERFEGPVPTPSPCPQVTTFPQLDFCMADRMLVSGHISFDAPLIPHLEKATSI